jgi:hypothetical protein
MPASVLQLLDACARRVGAMHAIDDQAMLSILLAGLCFYVLFCSRPSFRKIS